MGGFTNTFEAEEANRKELERRNAKKEAQKQVDHRACQSQIIKDTVLKVFDRPIWPTNARTSLLSLPVHLNSTRHDWHHSGP